MGNMKQAITSRAGRCFVRKPRRPKQLEHHHFSCASMDFKAPPRPNRLGISPCKLLQTFDSPPACPPGRPSVSPRLPCTAFGQPRCYPRPMPAQVTRRLQFLTGQRPRGRSQFFPNDLTTCLHLQGGDVHEIVHGALPVNMVRTQGLFRAGDKSDMKLIHLPASA